MQHVDYREVLRLSEGDVTTLVVDLYGWDDPAVTTAASAAVEASDAILRGVRADGETYEYTATSITGTTLLFSIDEDISGAAGIGEAEIEFNPSWFPNNTIHTANITVDVEPGPSSARIEGTIELTQNGQTVDVTKYKFAKANIAEPEGVKTITQNGTYNVKPYEYADVDVPQPEGEIEITENGRYNVGQYLIADVFTPVPAGRITIVNNGENIDVGQYKYADVNVPGIIPFGTRTITENGTGIDVETAKYVDVAVPITPEEDVIANFLDVRGSYPAVLDLSATRIAWATMYGLYARPYEEVILNADRISNFFFAECEEMAKATLINPSSIASHCFEHCASLQELHIQCTAVPTLDSQAFDLTPISSGTGKIYFPTQALADAAKQATNWSLFASKIYAEP